MSHRQTGRPVKLALAAVALLMPLSAQAHGFMLFGPQICQATALWAPQVSAAMTVLLSSSSQCVGYSYDRNGNRLAVTVTTVTPPASPPAEWGAANYGCFVWDE